MKPGLRRKMIDLDEDGYMDSSGLATLVEAMRTAKKNAVELVLASMNAKGPGDLRDREARHGFRDLRIARGGDRGLSAGGRRGVPVPGS